MTAPPPFVPHYGRLLAGLGLDEIDPAQESTLVDTAFLNFLIDEFARQLPFDPEFYGARNPDVVAATQRGEVRDLQSHFITYGFREGRLPHAMPFDAEYYLAQYPDLAAIKYEHGRPGLQSHFEKQGRAEGRAGHLSAKTTAQRWLDASRRTPYRLAHRSIDRALVQAFLPPLVAGPPLGFRGGLVLGSSPADRRLRHCRGDHVVDSFHASEASADVLAGDYVYGGPYFDHFGHAMAELIHRVLPARAVFDCRRLLFVGVGVRHEVRGFAALPAVMQAPLLFLGVDPPDVTVINDDRVVERLHVAQQGSSLGAGPALPYLNMLTAYTPGRLASLADNGPAAKHLYVSRTRVPHGGTLLGERYLERLLQAEGWQAFHPQDFSLVQQMQAYHRAEVIIFAEGSAVHGTELLGAGGINHCVLLPRRQNLIWWFENVLRPRSKRFDMLPNAIPLGTIVVDPESRAPLDNLGVGLMDLPATAHGLRTLGLAKLPGLDLPSYRRAARDDLAAYIAVHRAGQLNGAQIIDTTALAVFEARCAAALG